MSHFVILVGSPLIRCCTVNAEKSLAQLLGLCKCQQVQLILGWHCLSCNFHGFQLGHNMGEIPLHMNLLINAVNDSWSTSSNTAAFEKLLASLQWLDEDVAAESTAINHIQCYSWSPIGMVLTKMYRQFFFFFWRDTKKIIRVSTSQRRRRRMLIFFQSYI